MINFVMTNRAIHYKHILEMKSMTTPNVERYLVILKIRFKEVWKERNVKIKAEERI